MLVNLALEYTREHYLPLLPKDSFLSFLDYFQQQPQQMITHGYVFIQYFFQGITDELAAERHAKNETPQMNHRDGPPKFSKKTAMFNLYNQYIQQPQAQAVIAKCPDFSIKNMHDCLYPGDAKNANKLDAINDEITLLIFSKNDLNTCIGLSRNVFDALRLSNRNDYNERMNNIYLFHIQQNEEGKFNADCKPTSIINLDKMYAKEFPFLAMLNENDTSKTNNFTPTERVLNILYDMIALNRDSTEITHTLQKHYKAASGTSIYKEHLSDEHHAKLTSAFSSYLFTETQNRSAETRHPKLYAELVSTLLGKNPPERKKILMLLSLSALFSHLSSAKGLGQENNSVFAFRKLCLACLTKITEIDPRFLHLHIADWKNRLTGNAFDCTDILTQLIVEEARLECKKASSPLFNDIMPHRWR